MIELSRKKAGRWIHVFSTTTPPIAHREEAERMTLKVINGCTALWDYYISVHSLQMEETVVQLLDARSCKAR